MPLSFRDAVAQYQKTYDVALQMETVWDDVEIADLQELRLSLTTEVRSLLAVSELDITKFESLGRHLGFIEFYLDRNKKNSCRADIRDILRSDLPAGLRHLLAVNDENSHIDGRLKERVLPLVALGHNAAAVRCVFPVLSDRIRRIFNVGTDDDGDALINLVFGGGSQLTTLNTADKQAMRNLLSGFYTVFRNKYVHNDIEPSPVEVKAVVELANSLLFQLQGVPLRGDDN